MSNGFAGRVPILRDSTRARDTRLMADAPKIDMGALQRAIIEATGPGKEWSRNSLSLQVSEGRSRDVIRDIMRSKSREPELATVAGIAAALDLPLETFVRGKRSPSSPTMVVMVGDEVRAGDFRESLGWPADRRYPVKFDVEEDVEGDIIGLRTEGRSMDRVFPPGTDLQVVKLIGSNVIIQSGDYVIAERCQGPLRELTCKRLEIRSDGTFELWPESYLDEFQEPIFIGKPNGEYVGENETRIVGLVLNAKKSLYKNRRKIVPVND